MKHSHSIVQARKVLAFVMVKNEATTNRLLDLCGWGRPVLLVQIWCQGSLPKGFCHGMPKCPANAKNSWEQHHNQQVAHFVPCHAPGWQNFQCQPHPDAKQTKPTTKPAAKFLCPSLTVNSWLLLSIFWPGQHQFQCREWQVHPPNWWCKWNSSDPLGNGRQRDPRAQKPQPSLHRRKRDPKGHRGPWIIFSNIFLDDANAPSILDNEKKWPSPLLFANGHSCHEFRIRHSLTEVKEKMARKDDQCAFILWGASSRRMGKGCWHTVKKDRLTTTRLIIPQCDAWRPVRVDGYVVQ